MLVFIFEKEDGYVAIGTPVNEAKINTSAKRAVPTGKPFWIVNAEDIPLSNGLSSIRKLDPVALGDPDGHGERNV